MLLLAGVSVTLIQPGELLDVPPLRLVAAALTALGAVGEAWLAFGTPFTPTSPSAKAADALASPAEQA